MKFLQAFLLVILNFAKQKPFSSIFFDRFAITIDISPDNMLRYVVSVPVNTYLGLCYGINMKGIDMVSFIGNTQKPDVQDSYSTENDRPREDPINNYMTSFNASDSHIIFNSKRALNTGDKNDFVIPTNVRKYFIIIYLE